MMQPELDVFLQLSGDGSRRTLHQGRILGARDGHISAEFEEPHLELASGSLQFLHYLEDHHFVRQPVRVEMVMPTGGRLFAKLQAFGRPASAQNRECYRASTYGSDVRASLGAEDDCLVLDVSAGGFALWATEKHQHGDVLPALLACDGRSAAGPVRIQNVRRGPNGRWRYGVQCVEGNVAGGPLKLFLNRVNLGLQRRLMARLAGRDPLPV